MNHLRPVALLFWLALVLCGCATTTEVGGVRQREPDLNRAAVLNTQLGIDYLKRGEVMRAIEKLEKAVGQDDSFPQTHAGLALAYAQIGENARAEKSFKRARKLSKNDPGFLNSHAAFLCERGRAEEAEELFLEAAANKRYVTPEIAYTNAGSCARQQGQYEKAENYFRRALQANPRHTEALLQLSSLSYETGDYLRARAFLQRYEGLRRSQADSLLLGLKIEHALGDHVTAASYAERLRQLIPNVGQHFNLQTGEPL